MLIHVLGTLCVLYNLYTSHLIGVSSDSVYNVVRQIKQDNTEGSRVCVYHTDRRTDQNENNECARSIFLTHPPNVQSDI